MSFWKKVVGKTEYKVDFTITVNTVTFPKNRKTKFYLQYYRSNRQTGMSETFLVEGKKRVAVDYSFHILSTFGKTSEGHLTDKILKINLHELGDQYYDVVNASFELNLAKFAAAEGKVIRRKIFRPPLSTGGDVRFRVTVKSEWNAAASNTSEKFVSDLVENDEMEGDKHSSPKNERSSSELLKATSAISGASKDSGEVEDLRKQLNQKEAEFSHIMKESISERDKLLEKTKMLESEIERLKQVQYMFEDADGNLQKTREQVKKLLDKNDRMEKDNQGLKVENEELKKKVDELKNTKESHVLVKRMSFSETNKQLREIAKKIDAATSTGGNHESSKKRVEELADLNGKLRQIAEKLAEDVSKKDAEIDTLKARLETEREEREAEKLEMEREVVSLKEQISKAHSPTADVVEKEVVEGQNEGKADEVPGEEMPTTDEKTELRLMHARNRYEDERTVLTCAVAEGKPLYFKKLSISGAVIFKALDAFDSLNNTQSKFLQRIVESLAWAIGRDSSTEMLAYWMATTRTIVDVFKSVYPKLPEPKATEKSRIEPANGEDPPFEREDFDYEEFSHLTQTQDRLTSDGKRRAVQFLSDLNSLYELAFSKLIRSVSDVIVRNAEDTFFAMDSAKQKDGVKAILEEFEKLLNHLDINNCGLPQEQVQSLFQLVVANLNVSIFNTMLNDKQKGNMKGALQLKLALMDVENWLAEKKGILGDVSNVLAETKQASDLLMMSPESLDPKITKQICVDLTANQLTALLEPSKPQIKNTKIYKAVISSGAKGTHRELDWPAVHPPKLTGNIINSLADFWTQIPSLPGIEGRSSLSFLIPEPEEQQEPGVENHTGEEENEVEAEKITA